MFKEVYTYNEESNEYIGESITMLDPEETRMQGKEIWMIPPNSTTVKPELREGYAPIWNGESWNYVEDHRGEKGYIGKEPIEIKELGPLPNEFSIEKPELTLEEIKEQNKQEILLNLSRIDQASSRSLRAILTAQLSGQEPEIADINKLNEYESLAKDFRTVLAKLNG